MKQWELAARTYDLLWVDPFALDAGATGEFAFALDDETAIGTVEVCAGEEDTATLVLTSPYDFMHTFGAGGTVTVADAVGKAFAGSMHASFKERSMRNDTFDDVETISRTLVRTHRMDIRRDEARRLSPSLERALRALPTEGYDAEVFTTFFCRFGTHYSQQTVFGGIAYQRLTIAKSDFVRMLMHGFDMKAEAAATFKATKAGVEGTTEDTTAVEFRNATWTTRIRIDYAGGSNDATFAGFERTVAENPTAIELSLVPLYDLLTPALFPDLLDIAARRELLQHAMHTYLSSNGTNLTRAPLRFGEAVRIQQAGTNRSLGAGKSTQEERYWKLVRADDPGYRGEVEAHQLIALRSVTEGALLDSLEGLRPSRGGFPDMPSAQWRIRLVNGLRRTVAVEDDFVRIETVDSSRVGYLYGQEKGPHHVVPFVGQTHPGSIWQIVRDRADTIPTAW